MECIFQKTIFLGNNNAKLLRSAADFGLEWNVCSPANKIVLDDGNWIDMEFSSCSDEEIKLFYVKKL